MAPARTCSRERLGSRAVAFAEKAEIHRIFVGSFEHAMDDSNARRAGRGVGARAPGPVPPPIIVVIPLASA